MRAEQIFGVLGGKLRKVDKIVVILGKMNKIIVIEKLGVLPYIIADITEALPSLLFKEACTFRKENTRYSYVLEGSGDMGDQIICETKELEFLVQVNKRSLPWFTVSTMSEPMPYEEWVETPLDEVPFDLNFTLHSVFDKTFPLHIDIERLTVKKKMNLNLVQEAKDRMLAMVRELTADDLKTYKL